MKGPAGEDDPVCCGIWKFTWIAPFTRSGASPEYWTYGAITGLRTGAIETSPGIPFPTKSGSCSG